MRRVPWWTLLSSGFAPAVLISGSTTAAAIHGPGYNPVRQTISVLAADGRSEYWALTSTLIVLGVCHLATAWGLRTAALAGRLALACGGVCAIVLSLVPAPATGGSFPHGTVVTIGFSLLTLWPILAADRKGGAATPWALRLAPSVGASAVMVAGAVWFLIELAINGVDGVAERVLTVAQSLWPLVVVVSCLRHVPRGDRAT